MSKNFNSQAGIPNIDRKSWFKILGITLENVPDKWDIHFEEMIGRAAGRMYILRVCKYYGMPINHLSLLFNSLIMSLFTELNFGKILTTSILTKLKNSLVVHIEMVT